MILAGASSASKQVRGKIPRGRAAITSGTKSSSENHKCPDGAAWALIIPPPPPHTIKQRKQDYDPQPPESQTPRPFVSDVHLHSEQISNRKRCYRTSPRTRVYFLLFQLLLCSFSSLRPLWHFLLSYIRVSNLCNQFIFLFLGQKNLSGATKHL